MSAWHWIQSLKNITLNPWVRYILITLYYLAIVAGLILMYGKGDFSTPPFVYQGF